MPPENPHPVDERGWLQFVFGSGLGSLTVARLLARFKSPGGVLAASDDELAGSGLSRVRIRTIRKLNQLCLEQADPVVDRLLAWDAGDHQAIVTPLHAEYPELLGKIPVPPPVLFRRGKPLPRKPFLSIVGSRKATASGCQTARKLAGELARCGLSVASGMALGIDAAAHQGCLDGGGDTVAVLGCGADTVYPHSHKHLYAQILEQGCVISEFPPGSPPRRHHFPQRNRLISGLSAGTVIVEAGLRSGSLGTARHAAEQGREVFAVPGSVHSPNSRGPHQLIRDGAHLVEGVDDILSNLPAWAFEQPFHPGRNPSANMPDSKVARVRPELRRVWDALDFHPLAVDDLIVRAGLSASEVAVALTELEIDGLASQEGCGYAKACKAE